MAYPGALIYHISESGIEPVKYEETEHYEITKTFLDNPDRMLQALFRNDDNDAEQAYPVGSARPYFVDRCCEVLDTCMSKVSGTEGYGRSINRFIDGCQALNFYEVCKDFLDFLPPVPGCVLDAGAGAGQNAAALAKIGYSVTAVEPMVGFLTAARTKYSKLSINWLMGSLPMLECLTSKENRFDFILVDGVWHHLDERERALAMERFAFLLNNGGKCALSLRNGPAGMGICTSN